MLKVKKISEYNHEVAMLESMVWSCNNLTSRIWLNVFLSNSNDWIIWNENATHVRNDKKYFVLFSDLITTGSGVPGVPVRPYRKESRNGFRSIWPEFTASQGSLHRLNIFTTFRNGLLPRLQFFWCHVKLNNAFNIRNLKILLCQFCDLCLFF